MAVAVCPSAETLAAFSRGELAGSDLTCVADHVGSCEVCCRALKLVPDDSLAGLARAAAVAPATSHTVVSQHVPNPIAQIPAGFVNHSRYRIIGELGAGGMGTVYKAHDELMDRVVAVKVVSPHLTAKASALARFHREVRAAAKLEHVNIVRAYDAGEAGGAQFLVMEFVEGASLDRLVAKKGPLPVPMACTFARQAALGLQHAADRGMTHRDIKPQNLLVTKKGQVRVLDFGLARFARTDDGDEQPQGQKLPFGAGKAVANDGVTNPNLLMGTPDYLSPEQAKNSHDVDPRSDIYSLGCTLYYLLTGKPPFASAPTLIDKLLAHTEEAPPPIREARLEVSEGLADVLAKMMAKKPADRYQTAKEAADALYPFTRGDAAKGEVKEPVFEIVDAVVATPAPVHTPAPQQAALAFDTDPQRGGPTLAEVAKPKKKKHKKPVPLWKRYKWPVLGAVALFALIAGVVVLAANGGKKPTDTGDKPGTNETANNPLPQGKAKGNDDKGGKNAKGAKSNPWQEPTVITPGPGTGKTILFVLPSDGVYLPDYVPVRKRLEHHGFTIKTVSGEGGTSRPQADSKAEPVPVDYSFRDIRDNPSLRFRDVEAIIFCGYKTDEYTGAHPKSWATGDIIRKTLKDGKVLAAICVGEAVLVEHDVLRGKEAARSPLLLDEKPQYANALRGITWKRNEGVVTDGKIVTAAGPEYAEKFADAILAAIK